MRLTEKILISISEADQNFLKVIQQVENDGSVIILKDNNPVYIISKYNENMFNESDMIELVARRILSEHKSAFEELAK